MNSRSGLLAVAVGMVGALAAYQAVGEWRDAREYPPPGRLVDVGGRCVHLWAEGVGGPVVVVLPCLGGAGIEWAGVQRLLRDYTTVCLLDRGGLGWSDPAPWPRSFDLMAGELGAALAASDLPEPYVLVGHSTGGLLARLAAARYRDRVAALVLVDSSHEDQKARLGTGGWSMYRRALRRQVTPLGYTRLRERLNPERTPAWLPDDLGAAYAAVYRTRRDRRADVQELIAFARDQPHLRDEARQLGDLPVTMITAGKKDRDESWYPEWLELQDEIAGYSDSTTRVFTDHCGHHVHRDDPYLVADVIRGVVDQVRR